MSANKTKPVIAPDGYRLCVCREQIDDNTLFFDGHNWRPSIAVGQRIGGEGNAPIPYAKPIGLPAPEIGGA